MNQENIINDKNYFLKLFIITILIFILSFILRLLINFKSEFMIGVNGYYYPLQIRYLIENKKLAFSDMPFLFYFYTLIIKLYGLFQNINDISIINIIKLLDSIIISLIVFPLFCIMKISNNKTNLNYFILLYSLFSINSLLLISDLQKNSLAILFIFIFMALYICFQYTKNIYLLILLFFNFIVISLTHYGSFLFLIFYLSILLIVKYRGKALIFIFLMLITGLLIIYNIDINRFNRLMLIFEEIFKRPFIFDKEFFIKDLIFYAFYSLVIYNSVFIITNKQIKNNTEKEMLIAGVFVLFLMFFPFLELEYHKRIFIFSYIPVIINLIIISKYIENNKITKYKMFIVFLIIYSLFLYFTNPKLPLVDRNMYKDLVNIKSNIEIENNSIIISRHGLNWVVGWFLKTKTSQRIEEIDIDKYDNIYVLEQYNYQNPFINLQFIEPVIPENANLLMTTEYFNIYEIKK